MLGYSLRDLLRGPRRTLAAILGVSLGVGLFSAIVLFVDVSSSSMTARAIAPLSVDLEAGLSAPLTSRLTLQEGISAAQALASGEQAPVTLTVTNGGGGPANGVTLKDQPAPPLNYVPGTTALNGVHVADGDDGRSPLVAGLDVGTLAPGATATVTYVVAAPGVGVPSVGALPLGGSVAAGGDTDPTTANAPRRVTVDELRAQIQAIRGVTSADRLDMVDLPAGVFGVRGTVLNSPLRVFAFDPGYRRRYPGIRITSGDFTRGSTLLSAEAATRLGAAPGEPALLAVPGHAQPIQLSIGGIADLSAAAPLFSSRNPDSLGDFIYVPNSVVVSPEVFESSILPALQADAGAATRVVRNPPVVEVDVRVDRAALNADPATALVRTQALTKAINRIAPGQVFVVDNLSDTLALAKGDAVSGKVMFLFLGLPGVLLAGFLAAYAGGLLAEALRREHALLRARGASTRVLVRVLAYKTLAVAGSGSLLGLGLGYASLVVVEGPGSLSAVPARDLVVLSLLSVAAGVLTTALALYIPGRRALLRAVTDEGHELQSNAAVPWRRLWLDVVLLAAAAVIETVTYLGGGFTPTQTEGQAVSLSFYVLLAPLLAWFGATLLSVRLLLAVSPRIPVRSGGRFGPLVAGALRRTVRRRSRALASGIIGVSLALAFGYSVAIFVATYDAQKVAEAHFTLGADLRVTPSASTPRPPAFADRLRVPGVATATPVDFHVANATFGSDTKDMAAIDAAGFPQAASLPDSLFIDGTAAAAMTALGDDPGALLLDQEVARDLNIQVGDPVRVQLIDLAGAPVTVSFTAAGRFTQFPGFPQHVDAVANLEYFQRATGRSTADFFLVRTQDPSDAGVARVAATLRSGPGREVPLRVETSVTAINRDQSTLAALNLHGLGSIDSFFMALMSATAVVIFVFGLMLQRRREYVTLRALGIRRGQLQALLIGEAGVVAVSGLIIGLAIGTGMALMFVQVLRPLFTLPVGTLTFPAAAMSGLAGLVLLAMAMSALAASLLLRRLKPMELLRDE